MSVWRRILRRRRVQESLACRDAVALLSGYLEADLGQDQLARLESHLAACGHCSEYLEQLRATIRLAGAQDTAAVDPELRGRLDDVYRTWREQG